jgi:hypothetical protein
MVKLYTDINLINKDKLVEYNDAFFSPMFLFVKYANWVKNA